MPYFPFVRNATNSQTTADATTHTVTLATGAEVGDLLVVAVVFDGTPTVTWPAGWTQLQANAATITRQIRYRWADGTEPATLTLTTSASEEMQARAFVIGDPHPTAAPEVAVTSGTSTAPNPPSLTASWGAKDTLWAALAFVDEAVTTSAYPTNYADNQNSANSGGASGVTLAVATRNLNAATEDPGAFTISASKLWAAWTVAFRPDLRPVAGFTYVQTAGTYTIAFTDTTTNPGTYAWTFGDGGTSTSASPSRTYAQPGTYTVTLTATNAEGSSTYTVTLTVLPLPETPPARPDGLDVAVELYMNGIWYEITCDVLGASWTWGAGADQGVLTVQDAGNLSLTLTDPARKYDPQNAVSAYAGLVDIGTEVRVKLDTYVVFRGRLTNIAAELALAEDVNIVTMGAEDNVGAFGRFAADTGGALVLGSQTTSARLTSLADRLSWPAGLRDIGAGGETLQGVTIQNEVWPAMVDAVTSDGGRLQVEQDGTLHYRNRATAWGTPSLDLTVGCGGDVELESLSLVAEPGALINRLTADIVGGTGVTETTDAASVARYGSWTATKTDLQLTTGSARTTWASFVVNAQRYPAYGARSCAFTLEPGFVTSTVATSLIGDRWRVLEVHHGPAIDLTQRLLALAYTVGPTRVQVTATLGTDYGLVETTFRESWEAEAEWEVASAYGAQNVNGNSNQLQVTDRVV